MNDRADGILRQDRLESFKGERGNAPEAGAGTASDKTAKEITGRDTKKEANLWQIVCL